MAACINNDSYIITIVVMMHGEVIELNISHEKQDIFKNVHLLSLAGNFSEAALGNNDIRYSHLKYLNKMFQQDLNKSTMAVMQTAADRIRPAYADYVKSFFGEESTENSCKIFDNIQIDKALGMGIDGIFARMMQRIVPDFIGIYVISVHKKTNKPTLDNATLNLIYPNDKTQPNLNLLKQSDLIQFAKIFNNDEEPIIPPLLSSSSDIILLSELAHIIKNIVKHDKCNLNIIDYSCSKLATCITDAEQTFAQYMQPKDIENAFPVSGGKNARKKRRTHRRFAKKRYTKKRHRKNKSSKTSNNPIQKKQHKNT
jgi:hypothetical protein